ncbi:N2,N2-dimethylguanosine tRNA methyltransferase [Sistotremastrum niveocremeum HHB9708]|uniref:tRNA (guanine(26)-N(2))-dimethyltransferase n=1 Tax=Sistotremastrum niveocremeum HHB9708 TaxID=1314777 RepID=A0A165ALK5_9AGAM|nr:N2,N2-dimethylguanosine tRNA methyltransferase [Sistotremastrum niveocremeum HHB9708]
MSTAATGSSIVVPDGFVLHTENTAHLLLPASNDAFLNPVQEFNRDMSIACITAWSEQLNENKEAKWTEKMRKKREKEKEKFNANKKRKGPSSRRLCADPLQPETTDAEYQETPQAKYHPYKFTVLEALSATGLRAIRYAKEIPLLRYVVANDLSSSAVEVMRRNVRINGLSSPDDASSETTTVSETKPGTVRVTHGDACASMYSHRPENLRFDCIDLDPYGTAAPFIDGAVQAVSDGGLLCVTCTDLSILATNNYPEKCFANYGGIPVKAEFCHEAALRLVLHSLTTAAARYGRFIHPLVSLSIDFYVRLFVQVRTAPIKVKEAFSKTGTVYVCSFCQNFHTQHLGKMVEKVNAKGNTNVLYRQQVGPPCGEKCEECGSPYHVAGPMWMDAIHDRSFVDRVLAHIDASGDKYGTVTRMKGMLSVVKEELDTPFYFTPSRMASSFNCISPPLNSVASALLNAGHRISRSHAAAGSLKTSASRKQVHDVFRSWVTSHPVVMKNVPEDSPKRVLLAKEAQVEADFKHHPDSLKATENVKLVRYQQNPEPNWGPGTKAASGKKRKIAEIDQMMDEADNTG